MSLIQFAQDKDAVQFKQALQERIQDKVDAVLAESKQEVATSLILSEEKIKLKKVSRMPVPKKIKPLPAKKGIKEETVDDGTLEEKIITPGSVEHMAHAVHDCATGKCPAISHRGTFTNYDHPDYAIHRDNGSIDPDKHENAYHVLGAGGHHKFTVEHTSKGVDVKHVSKV